MSGVEFDEEGTAYWEEGGSYFPITIDEDSDYVIHDGDGAAYVLDPGTVDAALEGGGEDYVTRAEFYRGVAESSTPQPSPADLLAWEAQAEAEADAQVIAEEDAGWQAALGENMNLLEHRLGEKLTDEERNAIYEDAAKNGHTDPVPALTDLWAERSTSDGRRRLAAKAAQESMDAGREQDAEDAEWAEYEEPDPVQDMEPREALAIAARDSMDESEIEEATSD